MRSWTDWRFSTWTTHSHHVAGPMPRSVLLDDRDLATDLEDREPDLVDVVDALLARCFEHFVEWHVLGGKGGVDRFAIDNEHDGNTFEEVSCFHRSPTDVCEHGDPEAERRQRQERSGHRVVLLHHALLDDVAQHHQQHHFERRHVRERSPLQTSRQQEHHPEDHRAPSDDLHRYGRNFVSKSTETIGVWSLLRKATRPLIVLNIPIGCAVRFQRTMNVSPGGASNVMITSESSAVSESGSGVAPWVMNGSR